MNSLEELNNYANTTVTANDDRTVPYVVFDGDISLQAINKNEDQSSTISFGFNANATSKGCQIIEATERDTANVITITVDLSNSVAAQLTWARTPPGVDFSEAGGVYTATNIINVDEFFDVLGRHGIDATVVDFVDQDVNFSFTMSVSYPNEFGGTTTHTKPYNVVIGSTSDEMSFSPTTTQQIYEGQTTTLTDYPQVVDQTTNPNATYTMVIAPSTSGKLTFQTTQSFSYTTSGAEGISIGPFTKGTMNGYLAALNLKGLLNGAGTTDITFQLTNNLSGVVSNGTMTGMTVLALAALSNATISRSYTENEVNYSLYATSPPQLRSDLDTILGYGTYFVILRFDAGGPGLKGGKYREDGTTSPVSDYFQKTGTVAELNSFLANDVNFIPDRDQFGTHVARIQLWHGTTPQALDVNLLDDQTYDIVGAVQTGTIPGEGFYEYTTQGTLSITDSMKYFLHCDMYVVGAGGSANTGVYAAGGGGGGLTYTLDSDIVFENNITALEFTPGAANANNGQRAGDSYVKDYSGGFAGTTLIYAPGGGGGAHIQNNNGIAGGNGGGGAADTGTGGGTVTVTNSTSSLQGTTSGTSGQPFATYGWEYIDNAVGGNGSTGVAGNGGGTGISTDVRTFGFNEAVGGGGYGHNGAGRPAETPGIVATYNAQFGRGAWGNPTDSSLLTGRPGTIIFRFYQA